MADNQGSFKAFKSHFNDIQGYFDAKSRKFELPRSSDKTKRYREDEEDPHSKAFGRTQQARSVWREATVPHDIGVNNPEFYSIWSAQKVNIVWKFMI